MRVRLTRLALANLQDLQAETELRFPALTKKNARLILRAFDNLAANPLMGRPGHVSGTREIVLRRVPYILAYRIDGDEIVILTIRHTSRRWPTEFRD